MKWRRFVEELEWLSANGEEMIEELIKYLRETAQTCTRFARACPHLSTSHGLEEVAHDLMAKANELMDIQRS